MNYRADIDGLRAIAVLSVVFFHMGFDFISGGYVGVDVFFSISGYLIGYLVISKLDSRQFSFTDFFVRRVKRLFPAALVVYISTIFIFFIYFPPSMFESMLEGVASSLTFTSNIYFWQQGGYFGASVENNPMLHTWSLSVEEQFYIIFPTIMYFIFKFSGRLFYLFLALSVAVIASVFVAVLYAPSAISFAGFYLLPVRVYELGLGVLCAFIHYKGWLKSFLERGIVKDIGFVLIFISIIVFDENTSFPSYNALLPVIGCCFILISKSKKCFSYSVLTDQRLVFVGVISYSVYLWHWPVIVFNNWLNPYDKTISQYLIISVIIFMLSFLTWNYIERPFRHSTTNSASSYFAKYISINIFLLLVISGLWVIGNSSFSDPDGRINSVYQTAIAPEPDRDNCTDVVKISRTFHRCILSVEKPGKKKVLVWGDSHGSALMPAFAKISEEVNVYYVNNTGCIPLLTVTSVSTVFGDCGTANRLVWDHIKNENYDLVVLAAAFNNYLAFNIVTDVRTETMNSADAIRTGLNAQVLEFNKNNKKYIIIEQGPRFEYSVPLFYLNQASTGLVYNRNKVSKLDYIKQGELFKSIAMSNSSENLFNIFISDCSDDYCPSALGGQLLYKDTHHISNTYAFHLQDKIRDIVLSRL